MQAMAKPMRNVPSPPGVPPTSAKERFAMGRGYQPGIVPPSVTSPVTIKVPGKSVYCPCFLPVLQFHLDSRSYHEKSHFHALITFSIESLPCGPAIQAIAFDFQARCTRIERNRESANGERASCCIVYAAGGYAG